MESVRTVTYTYPREELTAVNNFYGRTCIIQRTQSSVELTHILDAALESSTERVESIFPNFLSVADQMHHAHVSFPQCFNANCVRIVIPDTLQKFERTLYLGLFSTSVRFRFELVEIAHRSVMDNCTPQATLFLHEDILARTLDYEEDLRNWRLAELEAGRSDPGRPEYDEASVFGGVSSTPHRYHVTKSLPPFVRAMGGVEDFKVFSPKDCPGIDDPANQNNFPIIDTLLSIPFSLLHNIARLTGIIPPTPYQQKLITMGSEIIRLWWWDPSPELIRESEEIRHRNVASNTQDDNRKPGPYPIHHSSRNGVTWQTKEPTITNGTCRIFTADNQASPNVDPCITNKKGLIIHRNELYEMHDVNRADTGMLASVTSSSATSDAWAWEVRTFEGYLNSDSIDEDVVEEPAVRPSSCDIISWYEKDVDARVDAPLPFVSTPFEKGTIGSSTANDVLMIKGLIDPRVYLQFLNVSSFSCL